MFMPTLFCCQELQEDIKKHEPVQLTLTTGAQKHLFGDDPTVAEVQERHRLTSRHWCQVAEGTQALMKLMVPWKELVDREVEFGEWCRGMKKRMEIEIEALGRAEGKDEDPTEFKTAFKVRKISTIV